MQIVETGIKFQLDGDIPSAPLLIRPSTSYLFVVGGLVSMTAQVECKFSPSRRSRHVLSPDHFFEKKAWFRQKLSASPHSPRQMASSSHAIIGQCAPPSTIEFEPHMPRELDPAAEDSLHVNTLSRPSGSKHQSVLARDAQELTPCWRYLVCRLHILSLMPASCSPTSAAGTVCLAGTAASLPASARAHKCRLSTLAGSHRQRRRR